MGLFPSPKKHDNLDHGTYKLFHPTYNSAHLVALCNFGETDGFPLVFWGKVATSTPPKTNMEPENGPLEKEIPIGNHDFQVPC